MNKQVITVKCPKVNVLRSLNDRMLNCLYRNFKLYSTYIRMNGKALNGANAFERKKKSSSFVRLLSHCHSLWRSFRTVNAINRWMDNMAICVENCNVVRTQSIRHGQTCQCIAILLNTYILNTLYALVTIMA